MIAQEAKYHLKCLVTLFNKTEAVQDKSKKESAENIYSHTIALAE